jgi:hypothetical protein
MRVTVNYRRDPSGPRANIQILQRMDDIERQSAEFHKFCRRKRAAYSGYVHVPADRGQWSNLPQRYQDVGIPYIACVKDVVHTM